MIIIQKPTKEDIRGIQEVFYKTWLSTYPNKDIGVLREDIEEQFKNRFSDEVLKKREKKFLNTPNTQLFLVAKENKKVVGIFDLVKHENVNQLEAIYILPEYQGRGIGKMFWEKGQEFFGNDRDIIVHVASYNKQAIYFYEKLGFVDYGRKFMDDKFKMPVSGVVIPEIEMVIKSSLKYNE